MLYRIRSACAAIFTLFLLALNAGASPDHGVAPERPGAASRSDGGATGRRTPCALGGSDCAATATVQGDGVSATTGPPDDVGQMDAQGWMRFDGSDGHIAFPVKVNGMEASAILDTGADTSIISAGLARHADIELDRHETVRAIGIHGQQEIPTTSRFTLEFAGRKVRPFRVPVAPAPGFDVVLGRGLFAWGVVQIDYPQQRIRFLDREVVEFESNVEMETTRRDAPMIEARVAGEKAWLLLDTGNAGPTLLKRRFVRRNDLDRFAVPDLAAKAIGAVSAGEMRLLQVPECQLGPYTFDPMLAAYNTERNEGFDGRRTRYGSRIRTDRARYDGILGHEVLGNFLVTMDLEGDRLHLSVP